MSGFITHQANYSAAGHSVAVVAARFNDALVSQLIDGAVGAWQKHGGREERLLVLRVPGAFELPAVAQRLAASKLYAAVVALGCVIRGDTPHFDFVAGECAHGLMQASLQSGIPIIFGVLTTNTLEQAQERASVTRMNKGGESMEAALEMANLFARL
jgi:6,7-dimethyl-8-ribityllumazine synthase